MGRRVTTLKSGTIDQVIGWASAVTGSTFASIQWLTEYGNAVLVGLNLLLAILGIILVVQRIWNARALGHKIRDAAPSMLEKKLEESGIIEEQKDMDRNDP